MKIRPGGVDVFRAERRTDGQTETTKVTDALVILRTRLKYNGFCIHFIAEVMAKFSLMHLTIILSLTKSFDALMILRNQLQQRESYTPSLYHKCTVMKSKLRTETLIFKRDIPYVLNIS